MDYIPKSKPSSVYYLLLYFIKLGISILCFQRKIFRDNQNSIYEQAGSHGKASSFSEEKNFYDKTAYAFVSHSTTQF